MTTAELKQYLNGSFAAGRDKWRNRNCFFYRDIQRFFRYAVPAHSRVLEAGLDNGWLLHALQPSRGVYLGLSAVLNEQGRQKYPDLTFIEDNLSPNIPLAEKFDYIILNNIVGVIGDVQIFFKRLHQIADPKSRIIVTYYNHLWEPIIKLGEMIGVKQKQPLLNWLSQRDIINILELSGFEIVKEGQRLLFPKYLPLVSEFLNGFVSKLPLIHRLNFWNYVVARPRWERRPEISRSVSVVVPTRNERGNIEDIVSRVPQMGAGTELIFVEGGSSDGTWEEIQRVKAAHPETDIKCYKQSGKGKGDAVRTGFAGATGDILMILDADMTVRPEDLPRFYEILNSGQAEYVHGSRLVYPMDKSAMRILNLFGNKMFSLIFSWLLKQHIKDTLCGTKVMFRSDYDKLARSRSYFGDFDPFGDFDLIFGASKLGLKIVEVPVHYKERKYGETNISRFRHGWLLLKMCMFAFRKLE